MCHAQEAASLDFHSQSRWRCLSERALLMSFPFIGAGDAAYFERAEIQVLFNREPSAAERAAYAIRGIRDMAGGPR